MHAKRGNKQGENGTAGMVARHYPRILLLLIMRGGVLE